MANDTNPIPPVTRDDPAAHSGDVVAENVAALKALFPSTVTDGKVDFDVLRQLMGDEVEEGAERYGLNWKGKARARAFALTPSLGTLRPAKDDSKDWDTTKNIVIEGDNLEVLKLLRKSYAGKVKLIYIDPPYNTGKDFVYPDNYTESLANYEALTGQRGEDGTRLTSNKESSGRFHTDWLNMMYPRLMLAKELLRDDGLLVVSLDDHEIDNLLELSSSIFGGGNHIATLPTIMNLKGNQDEFGFAGTHEYTVVYASDKARASIGHFVVDDEDAEQWDADHIGPFKKGATLKRTGADASRIKRPKGWFPIFINDDGRPYATRDDQPLDQAHVAVWPITDGSEMSWRWGRDKVIADVDEIIVIAARGDGYSFYKKQRPALGDLPTSKPKTIFYKPEYSSGNGTSQAKSLFGSSPFEAAPKPLELIQDFVKIFLVGPDDIALDFFAGSGTTGHAVMAQNAADGGNRRYILIQLPEPLDPAKAEQKTAADFCDKLGKPRSIAELTKERLRRAGDKVQAEHPEAKVDAGFRVYKLASSNLKPWQPGEDLERDLLDGASNVLDGRSEDDLLVELLLKTGVDLALPGETRQIAGRTVHLFGGGTLVVCLADIPAAEARAIGDRIADWLGEVEPPAPTTFFFKDSGFDPKGAHSAEARANLAATLRQRLGEDAIEKLGAI